MTRTEALEVARNNLKAHSAARLAWTFGEWATMTDVAARDAKDRAIDDAHGYRHGWYMVGEFSFCREDLTGEKYDITQGGWAFL